MRKINRIMLPIVFLSISFFCLALINNKENMIAHSFVVNAESNKTNITNDGWKKNNSTGKWYYVSNGKNVTGLNKIDNKLYYFDTKGKMYSNQWIQLNGKWHYAKASGALASDEWIKSGSHWYRFDKEWIGYGNDLKPGKIRTGYISIIDDGEYYLNWEGKMFTNSWQKINGKWKYFTANGRAARGWEYINGKWYYFKNQSYTSTDNYAMVTGKIELQNKDYYFKESGAMLSKEWYKLPDGTWYYAYPNGELARGWLKLYNSSNKSNDWFYFSHYNEMLTGDVKVGDTTYHFDGSGRLVYNKWIYSNGYWFYVNENGNYEYGWKKISGSWYYFNEYNGRMITGDKYIEDTKYIFHQSGIMASNEWVKVDGRWYHANPGGSLKEGWHKIGNSWYYFDQYQRMVTGRNRINYKYYTFSPSGAWLGY